VSQADQIKSSVRILDVMDKLGVEHGGVDAPHQIRCPFWQTHQHGDMHKSARVYPDRDRVKCFSCGYYYDVISLVRNYLDLSFPESLKWFADNFDIALEADKFRSYINKRKRKKGKGYSKAYSKALDIIGELYYLTWGLVEDRIREETFDFMFEQLRLRKRSVTKLEAWVNWCKRYVCGWMLYEEADWKRVFK
jgi:DNA primase